jgi:FkbM family methyltransferase
MSTLAAKLRWRRRLLTDGRAFPLWQRLRQVLSVGPKPSLDELLMSRLRRAPDQAEYFDMNGERVFFRPPKLPVRNEGAMYRGAVQILKEAYIEPSGFFCDQVQIRRGDVVFDLGGNLGTSAMLFAQRTGPRGRVYSFEPVYHELIERNVRENGLQNITVVPVAVAERSGEAEFAITDEGIDSRIDPFGRGGTRRKVPVTTIDDYCAREAIARVDFIKMDIEGAEEPALRGGEKTIRTLRPRMSIASYHRDAGFGGDLQHPKLVKLLREWGYNLREVKQSHIFAW